MPPQNNLQRRAAPTDTDSPHPRRTSRPRTSHAPPSAAPSQFRTPPIRGTHQPHPSPGLMQSAESVHPAAAAQAAIFSLFGRGRQRAQMMDEDDEESEGDVDDTFAQARRVTIDPEGNEVTVSDEEGDDTFARARRITVDPEGNEVMISDDEAEIGEEEDGDEIMQGRARSSSPLPNNLREISSLASWTVSTHKPECGVAALRTPSLNEYWQSDGPQPHTLTLHFFKLVAVVRIRVYLDFELDESYTPTKMVFLAGMGGNDLVEFATWEGETPCGWVNIPLEGVGGRSGGWVRKKRRKRTTTRANEKRHFVSSSRPPEHTYDPMFSDSEAPAEYDEGAYEDDNDETADEDDEDDPYAGSVLKAMVIQMRIIENHQNGKDTHVRGFQVFARDDERRRMGTAPSASADGRMRRQSVRKSLRAGCGSIKDGGAEDGEGSRVTGLEEPDWMGEPVIR